MRALIEFGIIAVLVIIIMIKSSPRNPPELIGGGEHLGSSKDGGAGITNYYRQHSHYPIGSWWIDYSEPSQKCHLEARVNCHGKYAYDNCYQKTLNDCNKKTPPSCPPRDLVAW